MMLAAAYGGVPRPGAASRPPGVPCAPHAAAANSLRLLLHQRPARNQTTTSTGPSSIAPGPTPLRVGGARGRTALYTLDLGRRRRRRRRRLEVRASSHRQREQPSASASDWQAGRPTPGCKLRVAHPRCRAEPTPKQVARPLPRAPSLWRTALPPSTLLAKHRRVAVTESHCSRPNRAWVPGVLDPSSLMNAGGQDN